MVGTNENFYSRITAVQMGMHTTYAERSEKQKLRDALNSEVEKFLAAKGEIKVLPAGFTHFPDGDLPKAKGVYVDRKQGEKERNEKIERINERVRAQREQRKKQREAAKLEREALKARQKEQSKAEREKRIKEQVEVLSGFFEKAKFGDLGRLSSMTNLAQKAIRNAHSGCNCIGPERWASIKNVLANFEYGLGRKKNTDRTERLDRQVELIGEFQEKAQFGDTAKLAKALGIRGCRITDAKLKRYAMSWSDIEKLEAAIVCFKYGRDKKERQLTRRGEISLLNKARKKEAEAKGEKKFIGFCAKENKEAVFHTYPSGVSYCNSCRVINQNALKEKNTVGTAARIKRKLADDARKKGQTRFTAECKKHGETMHYLDDRSYRCAQCVSDKYRRGLERKKIGMAA